MRKLFLVMALMSLSVSSMWADEPQKPVKGIDALNDTEVLSLAQNRPNPFSERTTIEVTIPESTTNAALFIYDMNGKQVKQINITERGKTNVSITSEGLEPGMFLYSLIADGKIVSTKKMILTN